MREFRGSDGRQWTVWEVRPSIAVYGERPGKLLHEDAAEGWLAFHSGKEKRRFFRPPSNWEALPVAGLDVLCRHATQIED